VWEKSLEEPIKNFLNAYMLRHIQTLKFQQMGNSNQPYKYDPAEGASYYGQLRAQGADIPKRFKGIINAKYRSYQDRRIASKDCLKGIYWTAAAEMVRSGKTAVMHVPVNEKTFQHYTPMLEEMERMLQFMIYDPSFASNGNTAPDWECMTLFHIPSRLSKDSFHVVVGSRLIYWTCESNEYGSFSFSLALKALCMALLYNMQKNTKQISCLWIYDVYERKVCELDFSRATLETHKQILDFLGSAVQGKYDL